MRLFVGIDIIPNEEIRGVLDELNGFGLRAVAEENLHINLKFLGEVDEAAIDGIKGALDSAKGFGEFDVLLNKVGAFPNADFIRVLWIGIDSERAVALAKLVDEEMQRLGFNKELSYTPHITLARVQKKTAGLNRVIGNRRFGSQTVKGIHLVRSTLGPNGPAYEKVYSVRL